jgi:fructose-1,6-bisphosphatase/inositol monophosphatase family enzyme
MLSTAFRGTSPERVANFTRRIARVAPHIEALRLPGAPGVMACAVAAGRYDIFTMMGQALESAPPGRPFVGQPWETAAFVVLVREAGGAIAGLKGGPPDILGYNVFAASPELIDQLAVIMAD